MAQSNWEADKMLDVYIYDYLLKRNLHASAKAFMAEGKVAADPVACLTKGVLGEWCCSAIDAPGGFLFEWWSVFWDIFIARTNEKHSEVAAAYIEAQQTKAREHQQQMQMQQLQIMQQRHAQMQRRDASHPPLPGSINGIGSDRVLGQSTASVLAAKMYEDRMKHPNSIDTDLSPQLLDENRMALLKSSTNQGQLIQGTPGNASTLQQIQAQTQQTADIRGDVSLAANQRPLSVDPPIYASGILQTKNPGLNQGASGLPLKGWPLTGIDQLKPNLGPQVQKSLQTQNQFQLLTAQQQHQLLAQAQVQRSIGSAGSPNYSDVDPRRFRALPRAGLNGKDGKPTGNEGSIGSPLQSGSPRVRAPSQDQAELLMKMKMAQIQQWSGQQQQSDQLQQQQLQQNNRKRKQPSSSGAANSTGTGNTNGPSPNSAPSTPSTHAPGDGLSMAANMCVNIMPPKGLFMYGADGPGGLASSTNQLEGVEHFGDGCLEDNVESFLSPHDDGDSSLFGALKRSPTENNTDPSKGFTFQEVGCLRSSTNKVICCHFSSDGKLLASAGHEKKAVLWNMDTLKTESTPEEHTLLITDVRFRPSSTQLATSSFDRTVRLWDAADPTYCLHAFTGHGTAVMSLDFHPKKTDILCSCDGNGEIRLWSSIQFSCTRILKGAIAQVRFQPRLGKLLAAAADNVISIFDFESDRRIHALQGHAERVHSICWDANGDYLASVSEDSVRVWSLASGGGCIHELSSNGNKFHSCIFHPAYPTLLVIGGYQSLELWNMVDNKTMSVAAHEGLIAALAQSSATGMVASASHDKCVKIWK